MEFLLEGTEMKLSGFGEKFAGHSGIVQLMDDLGKAMAENKEMLILLSRACFYGYWGTLNKNCELCCEHSCHG